MTPDPTEPRAAAREVFELVRAELETIANMTPEERTIATLSNQAVWIVRRLESAGLLATIAPNTPGRVVISVETANWASAGLDHAPWSELGIVQDGVRAAKNELHAAIDAAAERAASGGA